MGWFKGYKHERCNSVIATAKADDNTGAVDQASSVSLNQCLTYEWARSVSRPQLRPWTSQKETNLQSP